MANNNTTPGDLKFCLLSIYFSPNYNLQQYHFPCMIPHLRWKNVWNHKHTSDLLLRIYSTCASQFILIFFSLILAFWCVVLVLFLLSSGFQCWSCTALQAREFLQGIALLYKSYYYYYTQPQLFWSQFMFHRQTMAIFWATPGFKRIIFVTIGFSTEKTLISASAVPRCRTSVMKTDIKVQSSVKNIIIVQSQKDFTFTRPLRLIF